MKEEKIYELLAKHFSGETTPEEEKVINRWLREDPLNKEQYDEIKTIWNNTTPNNNNWDVDAAWKKLSIKTISETRRFSITSSTFATMRTRYANIAAILLVIIFGYFLLNRFGIFNPKENIRWLEKVTSSGEKAEIILPDNSKITLNGASRFKYPSVFEGTKREVELEGEAYFEIAHNQNLPFVVYAGNIATTVLGTKFNISAFKNEKNISVSLIEGKVKVSKKELNEDQPIIVLQPDQQFVYSKEANVSTVEQFDKDQTIGWKDDILKFDDEPLDEVFTRLNRAYEIKYELTAESFKDFKVTANFMKESGITIAEVLQKLTGLKANIMKDNNEVKKIVFEEK